MCQDLCSGKLFFFFSVLVAFAERNTSNFLGLFCTIWKDKGKHVAQTLLWRTGFGAEGSHFQSCATVLFPGTAPRSRCMQEPCLSTVANILSQSQLENQVRHTGEFFMGKKKKKVCEKYFLNCILYNTKYFNRQPRIKNKLIRISSHLNL